MYFLISAFRYRVSTDANDVICLRIYLTSFVPIAVPRKRRLQTLAVAIYELLLPIMYSIFLSLWYVLPFILHAYTVLAF